MFFRSLLGRWAVLLLLVGLLGPGRTLAQTKGIDLEGVAYPKPVKYFTIKSQTQSLRMAYMYERAPKANGQTVLLLHGKNFNGWYWGETMRWLLARGYDVLVPDQIGFGKSTKPENYQYSFQQLALNTTQLLDTLGVKKVIVLAHSMGGMLGTRLALQYPARVSKLVLLNPIGLEDWLRKVAYQSVDEAYKSELAKTPEKLKAYMLANYFHGEWQPAYDELLRVTAEPLAGAAYPRYAWNMALTTDMIMTQPVVHEFADLQVPTVLLLGQLDRTALGKDRAPKAVAATMGNYPALGKAVSKQIPNSRLLEIPGVGHLPHWENFALFSEKLAEALK